MESKQVSPIIAEELPQQVAARRFHRLSSHISPTVSPPPSPVPLHTEACFSRSKKLEVNGEALSLYMRRKHMDIQEKILDFFNSRPDLQTPVEISKEEHRELCMKQLYALVRETGVRPFRYVAKC